MCQTPIAETYHTGHWRVTDGLSARPAAAYDGTGAEEASGVREAALSCDVQRNANRVFDRRAISER